LVTVKEAETPRPAHYVNSGGLVIIIWAIAGPALSSVFEQAIDRVVGF